MNHEGRTKRVPWNKGKKWPKEVKEKISKTMKGNRKAWNKGQKWSKETKLRISKSMKRHHASA